MAGSEMLNRNASGVHAHADGVEVKLVCPSFFVVQGITPSLSPQR